MQLAATQLQPASGPAAAQTSKDEAKRRLNDWAERNKDSRNAKM